MPHLAGAVLQPLPDQGLAHAHVRLAGSGLLARIPKHSQVDLGPRDNLAHQAACFARAQPCGHTPALAGVLPVSADLPRGALLVQEIPGRPPALPADLPALAQALAALHGLPVPAPDGRAPLPAPADPLSLVADQVVAQFQSMAQAHLTAAVMQALHQELAGLQRLRARPDRPPVCLIAFDAHPGNFIVRPDGHAVLVDLEKCRYSLPGLDLAHCTLYTSTTWDRAASAVLTPAQVLDFHAAWDAAAGPALADAARPWQVPLRRAMWLWSLSWCCQWRVQSQRPPQAQPAGQDWSAAHSSEALVAHVRGRVDHYLSAPAIERVRDELDTLQRVLDA